MQFSDFGGRSQTILLERFWHIISFDILRLNEVTKNLKWEATCGCLLHASNKSWQSQIIKQPYCEPFVSILTLLFFPLCTSFGMLKHTGVQYMLKIKVISILLHVNQHFIAYHTLSNQVHVESLLTKPHLITLALTLIRPQNSMGKPKSQY